MFVQLGHGWLLRPCKLCEMTLDCNVQAIHLQQVSYKVAENRTRKAGEDTLELKVFKKPFASGGCRLAYYAQDSNGVRCAKHLLTTAVTPSMHDHA